MCCVFVQIVFENDDNNGKFLHYLRTDYHRIDDCDGTILKDKGKNLHHCL